MREHREHGGRGELHTSDVHGDVCVASIANAVAAAVVATSMVILD